MPKIEMIGLKFGMLTVKSECPGKNDGNAIRYLCVCDCGRERTVSGTRLRNGEVTCCGCNKKRKNARQETQEEKETREHLQIRWRNFSAKKQPICRAWSVFQNFYKWAIESGYQVGMKLNRYDENEPFSPDNCCWTMMKSRDTNIYTQEAKETINRWNRTVNVFRKHYGLKPFRVADESDGVEVDG